MNMNYCEICEIELTDIDKLLRTEFIEYGYGDDRCGETCQTCWIAELTEMRDEDGEDFQFQTELDFVTNFGQQQQQAS
jgi:hypothetical protein